MNFDMVPKENPRNWFLEHCVNEGNNFEVEVVHWRLYDDPAQAAKLDSSIGNECWNVYATIKPGHPLFDKLKDVKTHDYDEAMNRFPFDFHGGITYVHNDGEKITVGDDYKHLGDGFIERCTSLPAEVRHEAERLFQALKED